MELLNKAEAYIFNLFKDKLSCEYMYHDYLHTLRVVTALNELIKGENIAKNDAFTCDLRVGFTMLDTFLADKITSKEVVIFL